MAVHSFAINCNGVIHDYDWWSADEEEAYNWSSVYQLNPGGSELPWEREQIVDGEVKLKAKLKFRMSTSYVLSVYGLLELWEGGVYWSRDDSRYINLSHISAGNNMVIFDGRLKNGSGDWATIKIEIQVATAPQQPAPTPSFKKSSKKSSAPPTKQPARPRRYGPGAEVIVVAESKTGRNIRFKDISTGEIMSRREFVHEIESGLYPDYQIRRINGVKTPKSKPNATTKDNLG